MRVGNMARAIDHECPRYGQYPLAAGISFLKIDAGTLQHVFRGVIHFKGEAELLGSLAILIDQDRKRRVGGSGIVSGSWGASGDTAIKVALASDSSDRASSSPRR